MPSSDALTPSIRINTTLRFPEVAEVRDSHDDTAPLLEKSTVAHKLVIDVCSEFTEYTAALEYFRKNGKIHLVHDTSSRPLILTLGEDEKLYILKHGSGGGEGWSCFDITPEGKELSTFDIVQILDVVHIAVASKDRQESNTTHTVHYASFNVDDFESKGSLPLKMKWASLPDAAEPIGKLVVTSLLCKEVPPGSEVSQDIYPAFELVVGSASTSVKAASYFHARPGVSADKTWRLVTFPAGADHVIQTEPLVLEGPEGGDYEKETGMLSVFKGHSESSLTRAIGIHGPEGNAFSLKAGQLHGINSVFSHANPWKFTDLFAAGNRGIGLFRYNDIENMNQVIMKDVGFRQVVCSESYDESSEKLETKLAIFAVSDKDELYYIEGTRDFSEVLHTFTFSASELPLRRGVTHMSAKYNSQYYSSELLYATTVDNALHYMRRAPDGRSWTENKITRKGRKSMTLDAFVSTIVISDGQGRPVPAGYQISVTSDPLHVFANDSEHSLGPVPTTLEANDSGAITIIIPSERRLGVSPLKIQLEPSPEDDSTTQPFRFAVDPCQRVNRLMGQLKTGGDMKNATTTTGEKVFEDMDTETLDGAASVLGQYDSLKKQIENPSKANGDRTVAPKGQDYDIEETEKISKVEAFFGDVIETIKIGVKKTVKFVIRVVGPVARLLLKVAGKIFSFVLDAVDKLLTSIGSFMENYLGFDGLSRLLRYLKATFSKEATEKTQKVLKDSIDGILGFAERLLIVNRESISGLLDESAAFLRQCIDDPRAPSAQKEAVTNSPFVILFNNPIVRLLMKIDPIAWIQEAFSEEQSDLVLPSLQPLFEEISQVLGDSASTGSEVMERMFVSLTAELKAALSSTSPSAISEALLRVAKDLFWTLFDTFRLFIETFYDLLPILVRHFRRLLSSVFVVPGLSEYWHDLTGRDFTMLDFITYPVALLINLGSLGSAIPFSMMADSLPDVGALFDSLEPPVLYESAKTFKEASSATSSAVTSNKSSLPQGTHFSPMQLHTSFIALPGPHESAQRKDTTTQPRTASRVANHMRTQNNRIAQQVTEEPNSPEEKPETPAAMIIKYQFASDLSVLVENVVRVWSGIGAFKSARAAWREHKKVDGPAPPSKLWFVYIPAVVAGCSIAVTAACNSPTIKPYSSGFNNWAFSSFILSLGTIGVITLTAKEVRICGRLLFNEKWGGIVSDVLTNVSTLCRIGSQTEIQDYDFISATGAGSSIIAAGCRVFDKNPYALGAAIGLPFIDSVCGTAAVIMGAVHIRVLVHEQGFGYKLKP